MRIPVLNLVTGDERLYVGCTPEEAIVAAHAQALGDWCTWLYQKYQRLVRHGKFCVSCGDWTAFRRKVVL